jgi:uncharacterized delta-60 repeat protein
MYRQAVCARGRTLRIMKRCALFASVLIVAASFDATLVSVADAGAGSLTASFGTGGLVFTDFGTAGADFAHGVGFKSGRIYAVGSTSGGGAPNSEFAVARYKADGSLDAAFGTGGKVTTSFGATQDAIASKVTFSNGKIIVSGFSTALGGMGDFALARYNLNGSLDMTFGSGGTVTTDFSGGSDDVAGNVLVRNGKLLVAGYTNAGGSQDFAVARYNLTGTLDTSFNVTGKVMTDFSGNSADNGSQLCIWGGKIVVVGDSDANGTQDFAVARYNWSGSLDTSFNVTGKVTTDFNSGQDHAHACIIKAGKLIAVGWGNYRFELARYNWDGSLDATFGSGGKVTTTFGVLDSYATGAVVVHGKLLVDGYTYNGSSGAADFAVARYNSDGSLDATFGAGGKVTTDFGGVEFGSSVAASCSNTVKIVVSGFSNAIDSSGDFALAEYDLF